MRYVPEALGLNRAGFRISSAHDVLCDTCQHNWIQQVKYIVSLSGESRCVWRIKPVYHTHYSVVKEGVKVTHGVYGTTKMPPVMD